MSVNLEFRSSQTLFLPGGSDDEEPCIKPERKSIFFTSSDDDKEESRAIPPTSSSPAPSVIDDFDRGKKRKTSFSYANNEKEEGLDFDLDTILKSEVFADKRRKIEQLQATPTLTHSSNFESTYLGEFIIDDAYTTLSGRGHIQPGDEVYIVRESFSASTKGKKKAAVGSSSTSGKSGAMKQGKLNFAPVTSNKRGSSSKKEDNVIIRFENRVRMGVFTWLIWIDRDHNLVFRSRKIAAKACVLDS
jgi:DNA repair protein RAD5